MSYPFFTQHANKAKINKELFYKHQVENYIYKFSSDDF